MRKFITNLENHAFIQGEKLEPEALIVAQKILYGMGLGGIPETYSNFLRLYNGINAGECYLFGATINNNLDIIDQNKIMKGPNNTLLLGYNDFDLLGYNFQQKEYQIIDRADFEILNTYGEDELEDALLQIFNP